MRGWLRKPKRVLLFRVLLKVLSVVGIEPRSFLGDNSGGTRAASQALPRFIRNGFHIGGGVEIESVEHVFQ
jgi:hypothetical protein